MRGEMRQVERGEEKRLKERRAEEKRGESSKPPVIIST
jgi:hypothetical protein